MGVVGLGWGLGGNWALLVKTTVVWPGSRRGWEKKRIFRPNRALFRQFDQPKWLAGIQTGHLTGRNGWLAPRRVI
jgi:hypothetical protein